MKNVAFSRKLEYLVFNNLIFNMRYRNNLHQHWFASLLLCLSTAGPVDADPCLCLFSLCGSAAWLGLYYATYRYLGLLADSWIFARMNILLVGFTSSWRLAVPGPVVFYPLRGCSLILHARPAKAWISLRFRAVWSGSSLCALWKAGILYIFYAASEDFIWLRGCCSLSHTCVRWELLCPG